MNIARLLAIAGVPPHLHPEAVACIELADQRSRGLLWHKIKARFFRAGKIAKAMQWHHHRLTDARPEWADWDIAPMLNITGHGDNGPWIFPEGGDISTGRPIQDYWLDPDPQSADYQEAVAKCYWCPGHHPRSAKARKAWYRRNAGEYRAWRLGLPVNTATKLAVWTGEQGSTTVTVCRSGGAWLIKSSRKVLGKLYIKTRVGFEVDNVFSGQYDPQMWYPLPGIELRAPVTWSVMPGR